MTTDSVTETKWCRKCDSTKKLEEFHRCKRNNCGRQSWCKKCKKKYGEVNREVIAIKNKRHYNNNKELILCQQKEYYERTKDERLAYQKEYREGNKHKIATYQRWYRKENSRELRKKRSEYYTLNCEHIKNRVSAYNKNNTDKRRQYEYKRRSLKTNARNGYIPTLEELLVKQNGRCMNCCRTANEIPSISSGGRQYKWTIDHIIPLSKGGANAEENTNLLCVQCNSRKRDKDPEQWELENGRLPLNYGSK